MSQQENRAPAAVTWEARWEASSRRGRSTAQVFYIHAAKQFSANGLHGYSMVQWMENESKLAQVVRT